MWDYSINTTRVDQTKDTGNVDIGFHYVATAGSGNKQPLDFDGDQISDYVEDADGDNNPEDVTAGIETSPTDSQAVGGIADSINIVYDDVDLDGDGMVGRIEKALNPSNPHPLVPDNPLTLAQPTADGPGVFAFKVLMNQSLIASIGSLNLNVNGVDATLEELVSAPDSNCVLIWNTLFDQPGMACLQAQFVLGISGADNAVVKSVGPTYPFYSANVLKFAEAGALFDDGGAFLDAELAVLNATYTIELYDPSTSTLIKSFGPNSTASGMIHEEWNLVGDDQTIFSGDSFQAMFNVTLTDAAGTPMQTGTAERRPMKILDGGREVGLDFNVAYMYTPYDNSRAAAFRKDGIVWNGMLDIVDVLTAPWYEYPNYNSSFNKYRDVAPGWQPYPGYITKRTRQVGIDPPNLPTITDTLLPSLKTAATRQFYCYAHGSGAIMANKDGTARIYASEVATLLTNIYKPKGALEIEARNPYRFVFLDGCSTGSTKDWRRAFGIFPYHGSSASSQFAKLGPQAFVGWSTEHGGGLAGNRQWDTVNPGIYGAVVEGWTETMIYFYTSWMQGQPLYNCIKWASDPSNTWPLEVDRNNSGRDEVIISVNGQQYKIPRKTSKVYVVGHSGLAVDRLLPQFDNQYVGPD